MGGILTRMVGRSAAAGGGGYVEVGDIGSHGGNGGNFSLSNNFKSVISAVVPDGGSGGVWVKTFHILMGTATAGDKFTPIYYSAPNDSAATLQSTGQEYVFPSSFTNVDTEVSVNWKADGSALFIPAGTIGFGLITLTSTCRASGSGITYWNADTYVGGAASPFGTVSSSATTIRVWSPYSNGGP